MAARLGNVLYWGLSALAGVLLLIGLVAVYSSRADEQWFFAAFFGVPAVLLWLLGRACRYVLAAR